MEAKEIVPETLHLMCLKRHPNLEPARTLRVTSSPLAQKTRAKMGTCFAHPRKATYIGTKYGDNAAQEWTRKKHIVLKELTYALATETRHTERVRATRG
jgi:hypothetical protein